jgi:hypothetical protein
MKISEIGPCFWYNDPMTEEFSYFRASGASLAALRDFEQVLQIRETLLGGLARKFGANKVVTGPEDGTLEDEDNVDSVHVITHFEFDDEKKLPPGWTAGLKLAKTVYAFPPEGTPDHALVLEVERKAETAGVLKEIPLHNMLSADNSIDNWNRDHAKLVPVEKSSVAFVRSHALLPENQGGFRAGVLEDHVSVRPAEYPYPSFIPRISADYMQMMGDYYIRIPNTSETDGKPVFLPSEAVPVSFDQMLALDHQEASLRASVASKPATSPKTPKPN